MFRDFCFWGGCGWMEAVSGVILLRVPFRKVVLGFSEFAEMLLCSCFSFLFDLMCTFQVQRLSGTCLWYVKDLDVCPKCPQCFNLNRNVSISESNRVHFTGVLVKSCWLKLKSVKSLKIRKNIIFSIFQKKIPPKQQYTCFFERGRAFFFF